MTDRELITQLVEALEEISHKPNIRHILKLNCRWESGCHCEGCDVERVAEAGRARLQQLEGEVSK